MSFKVRQMVNGIPTTVVIDSTINHYDESVLVNTEIGVGGTGYNAAHTVFTLPNGETYNGTIDELKVYINGVAGVEGVDFTYGAGTSETTVTMSRAIPINSRVIFVKTY